MAFLKDVVVHGVTVPGVYHRVTSVSQQRLSECNLVEVTRYTDVANGVILDIQTRRFPYENIVGDVAAWGYAHVKALPEFSGAADV